MKIYGVQSLNEEFTSIIVSYFNEQLADKHCKLANRFSYYWGKEAEYNKLNIYEVPDGYNPYDKYMDAYSIYYVVESELGDEESFKNLDNYLLDIV